MLEWVGFQGTAIVVFSLSNVELSQLTLNPKFTLWLWTGYSRHPACLLSLLLLPKRSSLCASGCGEGNAILTQIFSL